MKKIHFIFKKICNFIFERFVINIYFFVFKHFIRKPHILSFDETVDMILNNNICVARYGDGEMKLMLKTGFVGFQSPNDALSCDLLNSFKVRNNRLLICYHDIPLRFPKKSDEYRFYKNYLFKTYRPSLKLVDKKYCYGNTNFTRFYHPSMYEKTDFKKLEIYVKHIKKIWENKRLLIVEGSETKLGIGNDLFHNSISVRRIICPSINAYNKIDLIYESIISNVRKDELVIVALGPTASVLCTKLSVCSDIQAIDIGHIDIVYLWYKNKCDTVCRVSGKYVNEAKHDSKVIDIDYNEASYHKQIIFKVE